ncbi:MAG: hypothetical protein ACXWC4_16795 [Telluria sp.]
MGKSFPNVLSGARWFAVCAVVLYHVRFLLFASYDHVHDKGLLLKLYYFVTGLGHEGFVLYMVTSGMLLGGLSLQRWSHQGRQAWRDVGHKAIWFYAYLLPGLLLGGLLDLAGSRLWKDTGVYAYFDLFSPDFSVKTVTENLLPVQRFIVPGLGSNAMLYLLAYECWAYLAFVAFFLLGRRRVGMLASTAIALTGIVLAPEYFGYLLLWLMGALVFYHRNGLTIRISYGRAILLFLVSLLTSRVMSPHDNEYSPHVVLILQTLLDLQFGVGVTVLLLALGSARPRHKSARLLLWRLNGQFPAGNSVILASHFPFMMFAVAAMSRSFAIPIAGEPRFVLFALFAGQVVAIYAYGWVLSSASMRLVRLWPLRRGTAVSPELAQDDVAASS